MTNTRPKASIQPLRFERFALFNSRASTPSRSLAADDPSKTLVMGDIQASVYPDGYTPSYAVIPSFHWFLAFFNDVKAGTWYLPIWKRAGLHIHTSRRAAAARQMNTHICNPAFKKATAAYAAFRYLRYTTDTQSIESSVRKTPAHGQALRPMRTMEKETQFEYDQFFFELSL